MEKTAYQKLTIAQLALRATIEVEVSTPANCHALISCSKSKGSHRDLARNMYVSPLYRKSLMVAEGWGLSFSILSAKHGLLHPDEMIEPYDLTLKGASKQFKSEWAHKVEEQIRNSIDRKKRLIVLAGDDYYAPLTEAGMKDPLNLLAPMRGLSMGNRLVFLNQSIRIHKRRTAIARSYEMFAHLAKSMGLHGVSRDAGIPMWEELVKRLAIAAKMPRKRMALHKKARFPDTFLAEILFRKHCTDLKSGEFSFLFSRS